MAQAVVPRPRREEKQGVVRAPEVRIEVQSGVSDVEKLVEELVEELDIASTKLYGVDMVEVVESRSAPGVLRIVFALPVSFRMSAIAVNIGADCLLENATPASKVAEKSLFRELEKLVDEYTRELGRVPPLNAVVVVPYSGSPMYAVYIVSPKKLDERSVPTELYESLVKQAKFVGVFAAQDPQQRRAATYYIYRLVVRGDKGLGKVLGILADRDNAYWILSSSGYGFAWRLGIAYDKIPSKATLLDTAVDTLVEKALPAAPPLLLLLRERKVVPLKLFLAKLLDKSGVQRYPRALFDLFMTLFTPRRAAVEICVAGFCGTETVYVFESMDELKRVSREIVEAIKESG
jgi:hypothetical protein